MSKLAVLEQQLEGIDVTKIVEYSRKVKDIANLNKAMAPTFLRDFIMAYDYASSMLAQAVRFEIEAKATVERYEAIAFLDKASDYLREKGVKDSAEARKQYINLDEDVLRAKEVYAKSAALVVLLKNKLQEFRLAHDDVKKMVYSEPYSTPDEGF